MSELALEAKETVETHASRVVVMTIRAAWESYAAYPWPRPRRVARRARAAVRAVSRPPCADDALRDQLNAREASPRHHRRGRTRGVPRVPPVHEDVLPREEHV